MKLVESEKLRMNGWHFLFMGTDHGKEYLEMLIRIALLIAALDLFLMHVIWLVILVH